MISKKRQSLKVKKKKSPLFNANGSTSIVVPQTVESFTPTIDERKVLYSAVYNKDPEIFNHFRLPPSGIKGRLETPSPCTVSASTFLPPPNIERLTRKPLYPLEIDVPECTNNSARLINQFFTPGKLIDSLSSKHGHHDDYETLDDPVMIIESPPRISSINYHRKETTESYNPSPLQTGDLIHPGTGYEQHEQSIEDMELENIDFDNFSESSFEKDLEEFDRLCREVDIGTGCISEPEPVLSCSICGIKLKQGSTSKDLEDHTAVCCPMDDIIIIDD